MSSQRILVVEDNETTRKMMRVALAADGYAVEEAGDAEGAIALAKLQMPQLIIQDIGLPGMDGFELVHKLRALPGGAEVPIVAFSGFFSRAEESRISQEPFDAVLVKPVEPSAMIKLIRSLLEPQVAGGVQQGEVLIADDDPVQLKLLRIRLSHAGFKVTAVRDGREALEHARLSPPALIVSDVLMPDVDGFQLCLAVRNDPLLAATPVVLVSANYIEEADAQMARAVGANVLVVRTPELAEVLESVGQALASGAPQPPATEGPVAVQAMYSERVVRQLERLAGMNMGLAQRSALQALILTVVASLSDSLARLGDVESSLGLALELLLDVSGVSRGALFLKEPGAELHLAASSGFPEGEPRELGALFGNEALVALAIEQGEPVLIPSSALSKAAADELLGRLHARSAILVPVGGGGTNLGALLFASAQRQLGDADWIAFARSTGVQLGQAIRLNRMVARLSVSEHRYRILFEWSPLPKWLYEVDTLRFLEVNDAAVRHYGYSREEFLRMTLKDLRTPEEVPGLLQALRARPPDGPGTRLWKHRKKDGTAIDVEINGHTFELEGRTCRLVVAQDVTAKKQAETDKAALEAQLRQSQKMEAIGSLAGGVAHDFNNVLSVVLSYSTMLLDDLREGDPMRADLLEIRAAGERAADLTRQLLAFSRRQVLQPRVVDLNAVVAGMEKMLRRLIGEDIELAVIAAPGAAMTHVDPGQMEQVLMNLVVNARDAMPKGGKLTVEIGVALLDDAYVAQHPGSLPGPHAMLAVTDSGTGMDEATQARIFEPFFTTKEEGKGTGLGLSTVFGIVKQSGGTVWVNSELGVGTSFKVFLPQASPAAAETAALPLPAGRRRQRGAETILLVEDEATVRKLARSILLRSGYEVIEAASGADAMLLYEQRRAPIDLLITDVVMPHMSGATLAGRLAASGAGLKVIFMSGYTDNAVVLHGVENAQVAFLQKPLSPEALLAKVRAVLDAPVGASPG